VILLRVTAARIDQYCLRVAQRNGWLTLHDLHRAFEESRRPKIVSSGPLEIGRLRQLEHAVEIARVANVGVIAKVLYARINLQIAQADLSRSVRRRVVANDEHKISVRL